METSANAARRRRKRTTNACLLCRRRKVKCSGRQPCEHCVRQSVECRFEVETRKVVVSASYLRELKRKLTALEGNGEPLRRTCHRGSEAPDQAAGDAAQPTRNSAHELPDDQPHLAEDENAAISNPLTSERSHYLTDVRGKQSYLGHSSTWSFSQQVMQLLQDQVEDSEIGQSPLHVDASAYDLTWKKSFPNEASSTKGLPSLDYAVYLTNTVKFHMGQLFHVFEEDPFLSSLHAFYTNSEQCSTSSQLWYLQCLLIMAFGKAFLAQPTSNARSTPPGSEFFLRAMALLPDAAALNQDPLLSMEVLCLLSLYLQAIDRRNDAYIYSGMALRMALTKGLHRETAEGLMDDRTRERRRKIWWTVYVLDRKFSSSMGVPLSVQDIDITVEFPQKSGSQNSTALSMNAKLSRLMTHVMNTVYGVNRLPGVSFLKSVRTVLRAIADVSPELEASFEMQLDDSAECVSRVSGSLNISYHHCIILSIRPLILYCLQKRFHENSSSRAVEPTSFTNHIHALLNACLDSARKVLAIITILYDHGLLDSFIPFDLESLFSSASVMLLMNAIVSQKNKDSSYMTNTRRLLDTMISRGNNLAKFRLQELEHMERLVSIAGPPNELPERSTAQTLHNTGDEDLQSQLRLRPRSFAAQSDIGPGLEDVQNGLALDQIVSVADLLELDFSALDDEIPLEDEWLWSFSDL